MKTTVVEGPHEILLVIAVEMLINLHLFMMVDHTAVFQWQTTKKLMDDVTQIQTMIKGWPVGSQHKGHGNFKTTNNLSSHFGTGGWYIGQHRCIHNVHLVQLLACIEFLETFKMFISKRTFMQRIPR